MTARTLSVPALVIAVLALTGCPPKYPKCDKDEHCKVDGHDEVCVNGQCQECGKDTDCKAGFVCKETKCVPKPECSYDTECQPGFKCRAEKCTPECTTDSECMKGMQCRAGRCSPAPECASDADCPAGKKCDASQRCTEGSGAGGACTLETVHFDFNEFALTGEARRLLDKNADCIKTRKIVVSVAGHCDERGTEEYNLHLGEKRANSVKKYLTNLGVEGGKVSTISYGKERPIDSGHTEAAWARNRRAETSEK